MPGEIYRSGNLNDLVYPGPPHGPEHGCAKCRDIQAAVVRLKAAVAGHPIDFGVSMRDEVFQHKLHDGKISDGRYCYWSFPHGAPKGSGKGSRMWVANGGHWVGFFVINSEELTSEDELAFYSESFVRKDGGARRPFMGYTLKVPPREN